MNEPLKIRAGVSYTWEETSSDYPASDGWDLKYTLSGPVALSITCTKSGDTYTATISKSDSATLAKGYYTLYGFFEKGTEVHEHVVKTNFEVQQNLTTASATEQREFWQIILDQVQQRLKDRTLIIADAKTDPLSGKSIQYLPLPDLIKTESHARYQLSLIGTGGRQKNILPTFLPTS